MPGRNGSGASGRPAPDADVALQFRVWLKDVSPMAWRRVSVVSSTTLRELHGVLQVAMGWEGIHLYQFVIRTVRYGSWETGARSANVPLTDLKLRQGGRFVYEYDLNIPWEHEIRLEARRPVDPKTRYPTCTGGSGACPLEDSGGPARWLAGQDEALGFGMLDDLAEAGALLGEAARTRSFATVDDGAGVTHEIRGWL